MNQPGWHPVIAAPTPLSEDDLEFSELAPQALPGVRQAKSGIRLVTLCGSAGSKADAMRDVQNIIEKRFCKRGITVRPVDLGSWSLATVPAILREIRRQRPDVILMQYPTAAFGASLGPVAVGAIQRIAPLVVMLHEFVAAHPLRKLAVGMLTARADLVATTAEREAQQLARWYPWLRTRLRQIPIASNIPGRPWSPTLPQKVVYFGQIRPEKGLEEFLECQARVVAALPDVDFQIIGATVPKFAAFSARMQEAARARGIKVLHELESDDVADALAAATVALLPFPDGASFRRGSLFAAAACGVPFVTNVGADTPAQMLPYLESANGAAELTALTLRYLEDQQSRSAAHDRSLQLSDRFGWKTAVDRYLDVFHEATSKQPYEGYRNRSRNG